MGYEIKVAITVGQDKDCQISVALLNKTQFKALNTIMDSRDLRGIFNLTGYDRLGQEKLT